MGFVIVLMSHHGLNVVQGMCIHMCLLIEYLYVSTGVTELIQTNKHPPQKKSPYRTLHPDQNKIHGETITAHKHMHAP